MSDSRRDGYETVSRDASLLLGRVMEIAAPLTTAACRRDLAASMSSRSSSASLPWPCLASCAAICMATEKKWRSSPSAKERSKAFR